ncbi:MAG: hypothetical protein ACJ797_09000 [Ktedonobacteraceae bacterium]
MASLLVSGVGTGVAVGAGVSVGIGVSVATVVFVLVGDVLLIVLPITLQSMTTPKMIPRMNQGLGFFFSGRGGGGA